MLHIDFFSESTLTEVALLLLAFVLSALIGIERERNHKSAGLRTHILVGLGAAVFTLVSIYGFGAVLGPHVSLDPSRIAAGIVSGIGFLGAGVIFVRQNIVNGLTTAASIWMTAAIGMATGAGMVIIAVAATGLHLLTVSVLTVVARYLPKPRGHRVFVVTYKEAHGVLREVLARSTTLGYKAALTTTNKVEIRGEAATIESHLHFEGGKGTIENLVEQLSEIKGVISVHVTREDND